MVATPEQKKLEFNPKQVIANRHLKDHGITYGMLYGGGNSGKTWMIVRYILIRAAKYQGSQHFIGRAIRAQTKTRLYLETVKPMIRRWLESGQARYWAQDGILEIGESPIHLGGLRDHGDELENALGPKYATIFCNEISGQSYHAWEMMSSRLYAPIEGMKPMMLADQNPTIKQHWSNQLFRMKRDPITKEPLVNPEEYASVHFTPYDNRKNIGGENSHYIRNMENASEDIRRRFLLGDFGSFKGLVYKFNEDIHIVDPFLIPKHWPRGRSIDFGFDNPFACYLSAYDKANDRIYYYAEHYAREMLVEDHAKEIHDMCLNDWHEITGKPRKTMGDLAESDGLPIALNDRNTAIGKLYRHSVADHDSGDQATLARYGVATIDAKKSKTVGIEKVIARIHYVTKNGLYEKQPRLFIFNTCVNMVTEAFSYKNKDPKSDNINVKDREPVDANNHAMDCMRYDVMAWDQPINKSEEM